jgi:ribosome-associated heat shock protein Hsp15
MARPATPAPPGSAGTEAGQRLRRAGGPETIGVRLDRYLYFVRLLKSRTQAQGLIEGGHVRIDGKRVAKPSEEVRPGQVIALPLHGQVRVIRVLALPERRGPAPEARSHYEEI